MSEWDFLHDMRDAGYTSYQIAEAAAHGYNFYEISLPEDEGESTNASRPYKQTSIVVTKEMTNIADAKIYAALKFPTALNLELQNRLGLSTPDFTKAVNELIKSKKIKRSLEDNKKWIRNS